MAIKSKLKKKHSALSKRSKISYETKDQGGGGSRVINWKDVDTEVKFFQPNSGRNAINIIPFEIKSKNHPLVKTGQMEIGEPDYCLDIWVHRNIGPTESSVLCLKRTYGKACPVCEEENKLRKLGKGKEAGELAARRRVFYNVEDTRKAPGELQVFEVSHFLFEKELIDEARGDDGDDDSANNLDFADAETGSIVKFKAISVKKGGFEFNEYKSFSFEEREDALDEELIEKAISFDEYLNVMPYEEIEKILYGTDEDSEEDDDDDDDEEDEKPLKNNVKKYDKKKTDTDADEEDEDDIPKKTGKKPEKVNSSKSAKGKCPHGYNYGRDADDYEECEDCDIWSGCTKKQKEKE